MKIETLYNVGDKVWVKEFGPHTCETCGSESWKDTEEKHVEMEITAVQVTSYGEDIEVMYSTESGDYLESEVSTTKPS